MVTNKHTTYVMLMSLTLCACGGGGGDAPPPPVVPAAFTVGGSVSGLTGSLVLRNNGADDRMLSNDGNFTFATALLNNTAYSVSIASLPTTQACAIHNGSGVVSSANITNISVTCVPAIVPPPPAASGSLDTNFGNGGKVVTDFSGPPP